MHHITEDTPPDMLAGAMDLSVRLPDGRDVNIAIERSTPMMDLLVQVTTAYKLRPSDHILQALDMSERERALPYKPNTPIGALDTQQIRVLPKGRPPAPRAPPPPGHQPFESTFRLQVHLPRNQFCVIRVGKFVMLEDIMRKVCEEKNLDPRKYEFRHPANIDKVLDPKRTLNDYEITEITVVHRGSPTHLSQTISSSDIMGLQREEEKRKLQAKTGGGVLNLIFRRGRTSMGSGSVSSDTRSISPTQSDDSRSVTPPAVQPPILPPVPQEVKQPPNRPKPPQRKRRPAPKPPSQPSPPAEIIPPPPAPEPEKCQQEVTTKLENGLTICHSRNSSDSSGYHEASILSDNCTTLPRRPKSTVINTSLTNSTLSVDQGMEFSNSTGNLSNMTTQSKSTMSLTNAGRKKKAPPPPPVLKSANSVANISSVSSSVPVVASSNELESTPKVQSESTCPATPRNSDTSINTASLASFSQDSSSIQSRSRSSITTPDLPISKDSNTNSPAFTSTPTRSQSQQSSVEDKVAPKQPKVNVKHEVSTETKAAPERKQSMVKEEKTSTEIQPERKKSIIEIEQERKQSLVKEVKLLEQQRKQTLVNEEKIVQEPTSKEEKVPKKVKEIVDKRTNLTDAQKLDPIKISKTVTVEHEDLVDAEWQYTLPSPPTAFRDSSPTNFTDVTNYDTVTFNGLTSDSVVSNPVLFEKLESIRDTRSETETIVSEVESSTSSKQEEVLTSKYLNLENLEKRKSLVLERELASLKNAQNHENSNSKTNEGGDSVKSQRDSLRNEIEEAIQQKSKSATLSRTNSQSREKILLSATDSTLPNFKITTYDQPKSKINIYEDDTIRSNVENISANTTKRNSIIDLNKTSNETEDLTYVRKRNSLVSASTENMFFAKRNSMDEFLFKKPQEFPRYKKQPSVTNLNDVANGHKSGDSVSRSESFSTKNNFWSRSNPVKRSKSHISLDKYKDETKKSVENSEEGLHKSNSLFNVSGLQSLEVMRMILPKLGNTPPSTPSEDPKPEPPKLSPQKYEPVKMFPPRPEPANVAPPKQEISFVPPKLETSFVPLKSEQAEKEIVTKKYQYSGPPAINLGTWTERPKSQVSIKEDQDYKISNISAMKSKFNSQTNLTFPELKKPQEKTQQSYPSVNIRVNSSESKDQVDSGKINIKINSESAKTISHQSSGNVIIKIGNNESSKDVDNTQIKPENKLRENSFYSRFLNQTTAVGYRKPLGNINGVDKPRPHSIAFDANCPDLSRVPIVRAVELKKPFKETQGNKSVTQITHDGPVTDIKESPTKNGSAEYHNSSPVKSNTLRHSSVYLSSENLNKIDQNGQSKVFSLFSKPITRGNSFASTRNTTTPVVKGFRVPANKETEIDTKQYGTLPSKSNFRTIDTNVPNFVPFSQSTLKRTENSIIARQQQPEKNIFENIVLRKTVSNGLSSNRHSVGPVMEVNGFSAPPPPQMPKITAVTKKSVQRQLPVEDSRDQLLESIRSFGGKSGLRAVK